MRPSAGYTLQNLAFGTRGGNAEHHQTSNTARTSKTGLQAAARRADQSMSTPLMKTTGHIFVMLASIFAGLWASLKLLVIHSQWSYGSTTFS